MPEAPTHETFIKESAVLTRVNPENPDHIAMAHTLDEASAEADLLTEDAESGMLSPDEFERWTTAGNTPRNFWRQMDFIGRSPGDISGGFINSYRPNAAMLTILSEAGALPANGVTDEIQWYVRPGSEDLQLSATRQHVSSRFKTGTEYIVVWTDEGHTPEEVHVLDLMGFKPGPDAHYEGEAKISHSHILDQGSFVSALLTQMGPTAI